MSLPSILHCDNLGSEEIWAKWADDYHRPACINDLGFFFVAPDPLGIRDLMMPPFSMAAENTAFLYVNRKLCGAEGVPIGYTWYPDRVVRRCAMEGLGIESETRAVVRQPAALLLLTISNTLSNAGEWELGIKLGGRAIHAMEKWAAPRLQIDHLTGHPESWQYEPSLGAMQFSSAPRAHCVQGSLPAPDTVEHKSLLYRVSLKPGETWQLRFVVAFGDSAVGAVDTYRALLQSFDGTRAAVHEDWENKLRAAFTPGNSHFSGHLPTLHTRNKNLERLYYMGAVGGALCSRRDNPLARLGTVYTTLTGDCWPTACFLWDMMICDPCWAMLDPAVLKKMIEAWMSMDLANYQSIDYLTGKGLGCWYAVNDAALVHMAHTYLRYSGDRAWLNKVVEGATILDRLESHARRWRVLDKNGHGLADCGNGWNCGDGLTTWVHETAGFNAAWVAALRQVAEMREIRGEDARGAALLQEAALLLDNVRNLYAAGEGFWHARMPDGSLVPTRLLYDLLSIGENIPQDLSAAQKAEILGFFEKDLRTETWVRGLSQWDDDSIRSYRPDWAWTGSYGAFPAMALTALRNLGASGEPLAPWLDRVALATFQGPIGQTHLVESFGETIHGGARKALIGAWSMIASAAFPAAIVETMFGAKATLQGGLAWNGFWALNDPGAELHNIPCQGRLYAATKEGIRKV